MRPGGWIRTPPPAKQYAIRFDSMRAKLGSYGGGSSDRFARALRAGVYAFRNTLHEPFPDGAPTPEQVYDTSDGHGGRDRSDRKKALILPRRDVAAGGELRYALIEHEPCRSNRPIDGAGASVAHRLG